MATITFENSILLSEDEDTNLETFYEINEFVQMINQGKINGFRNKHLLLRGRNNGIDVYQKGFGEKLNVKILSVNFL
jgi:hypothetical protein